MSKRDRALPTAFGHVFFLILAAFLLFHGLSFFGDFQYPVIRELQLSADSKPFTMNINFDKFILGLIVLGIWGLGSKPFSLQQTVTIGLGGLVTCLVVLIGSALALNYVRLDIKWPPQTFIFMLNHLFVVSFSEELFFRHYLQGRTQFLLESKFKDRAGVSALLLASVVFGASHFQGGFIFVILSSVAGLFYGWAYLKTQRVEASILIHFGVNAIHFVCFSYPALQKG